MALVFCLFEQLGDEYFSWWCVQHNYAAIWHIVLAFMHGDENGDERFYTALVKVGFCDTFELRVKVMYRSKWAVSSKTMIAQTPYNVCV